MMHRSSVPLIDLYLITLDWSFEPLNLHSSKRISKPIQLIKLREKNLSKMGPGLKESALLYLIFGLSYMA